MMLFSYDRGAAHQYAGWSQRKSVSIDTDGIVYRRRYVIGKEDEARTVAIGCCDISCVQKVLFDFHERIAALSENGHVNVGSHDGSFFEFVIQGKKVYAQNLNRYDLAYEKIRDEAHYNAYKAQMIASNTLWELLDALAACVGDDVPELGLALRCHCWISEFQ